MLVVIYQFFVATLCVNKDVYITSVKDQLPPPVSVCLFVSNFLDFNKNFTRDVYLDKKVPNKF